MDEEEIIEETEQGEPSNEEEVLEETSGEPSDTLTEQEVKEAGLGQGFVGQPRRILIDVLKNQNKQFTQMTQAVSQMQKDFKALQGGKNSTVQKTDIEDLILSKLPPMPDSLDDPKAAEQWTKNALKTAVAGVRSEFKDLLEEKLGQKTDNPELQKLVKAYNTQILTDNLETNLSEIYGEEYTEGLTDEALKDYEEYLSKLPEARRTRIMKEYSGDPEGLADAIIIYHKAKNFGGKKALSEEEKRAHEKEVKKLKNTNKKFVQSAPSPRDKIEETKDSPYDKLIKEGEISLAKSKK